MLLDIGIGILSAIVVSKTFAFTLTPLLVGLGIAFALLPDIDFIYTIVRRGLRDHRAIAKHRDLIHYPLIYLPLGVILAFAFGPQWALLFLMASVGHFIHDSIGIGWGIPWLWPFTNRNYSFLYRYAPPGKMLPKRVLYRWDRTRIDHLIEEHGDPNWLRNIYLKLHPFFLAELVGFVVAVVVLIQVTTNAKIERVIAESLIPEVQALSTDRPE